MKDKKHHVNTIFAAEGNRRSLSSGKDNDNMQEHITR